jgi:hypothetical protein
MKNVLSVIAITIVALGIATRAEDSPYNLKVHVVNFHEDRFIHQYRAEVIESGTPYMLIGLSQHRILLQVGQDYPALRAKHGHRDNFRIVTPDGNAHWFEISK